MLSVALWMTPTTPACLIFDQSGVGFQWLRSITGLTITTSEIAHDDRVECRRRVADEQADQLGDLRVGDVDETHQDDRDQRAGLLLGHPGIAPGTSLSSA